MSTPDSPPSLVSPAPLPLPAEVLRWVPVGVLPVANGAVRMSTYQDALGEMASGWVSAAVDITGVMLYALWLRPPRSALQRGAFWVALSTLLHFALGRVFGLSMAASMGKYDLLAGEPWLLVTLMLGVAPLLGQRVAAARRALRPRVVLLVGPKGAGKTTLGRRLGELPNVHFMDVEPIARAVLASMGNVITERYARRAFDAIRRELRRIERLHSTVVLETTGASEHSRGFVDRLAARYELALVRVAASASECQARIAARDPSGQIPVGAELIREMHGRFEALAWPWALELDNGNGCPLEESVTALRPLLREAKLA